MDPLTTRQIQDCNWQVVNASTPANYFHVLRRQVRRDFRKPLIIMTPKSLLRDTMCRSNLSEFEEGSKFQRVIPEQHKETGQLVEPQDMRKVVFCSGKIYYELLKQRSMRNVKDVALIRVEQISPFPFDLVAEEVSKYNNAEVLWCQEESKNMGAWAYVQPRFATAIKQLVKDDQRCNIGYAGRDPSAAPATGSQITHQSENTMLMAVSYTHLTLPTILLV